MDSCPSKSGLRGSPRSRLLGRARAVRIGWKLILLTAFAVGSARAGQPVKRYAVRLQEQPAAAAVDAAELAPVAVALDQVESQLVAFEAGSAGAPGFRELKPRPRMHSAVPQPPASEFVPAVCCGASSKLPQETQIDNSTSPRRLIKTASSRRLRQVDLSPPKRLRRRGLSVWPAPRQH